MLAVNIWHVINLGIFNLQSKTQTTITTQLSILLASSYTKKRQCERQLLTTNFSNAINFKEIVCAKTTY